MNLLNGQIEVRSFLTVTLGILVLFLGKALNKRFAFLREFTIPEPVSGGLLVASVIALLHLPLAWRSALACGLAICCWCISSPRWA